MEEQEEVKFERRDGSPGKCLQTHCGTECPLKDRNVKTLPYTCQPAPNANKYKHLHQKESSGQSIQCQNSKDPGNPPVLSYYKEVIWGQGEKTTHSSNFSIFLSVFNTTMYNFKNYSTFFRNQKREKQMNFIKQIQLC